MTEANEGEQVPTKNPLKGCPCLVNPFVNEDPLVISRKLAATFPTVMDRQNAQPSVPTNVALVDAFFPPFHKLYLYDLNSPMRYFLLGLTVDSINDRLAVALNN